MNTSPTRLTKAAILIATLVSAGWNASGVASADPAPPPSGPRIVIDRDGTFAVGTDIVAGTYSSAGPVDGGTCFWKRLSSLEVGGVIDSALSKMPQLVQIAPSDAAFKTSGCQPWQRTDPANVDGATSASLPPSVAQDQLRTDIDTLNRSAGQFGGAQLPRP